MFFVQDKLKRKFLYSILGSLIILISMASTTLATEFNLPSCWVLSSSGVSIDSNCDGIVDASSFANFVNSSIYYNQSQINSLLALKLSLNDQRFNESFLIFSVNSSVYSKFLDYYNKFDTYNRSEVNFLVNSINFTNNFFNYYNKSESDVRYLLINDQRYNDTLRIDNVNSSLNGRINSVNISSINMFNSIISDFANTSRNDTIFGNWIFTPFNNITFNGSGTLFVNTNALFNKNVGIGINNPSHILHLSSGNKTAYVSFSGSPLLMVGGPLDYGSSIQLNNGRIQFGRDGSSGGGFFHNNDANMRAQIANSFWIYSNSFNVGNEDASNAFGGSVRGGLRLQTIFNDTISDAGVDKIALRVRVTDGGTGNKFLMNLQNGTTSQFSVSLNGTTFINGNVGIGLINPTDRLDINGSIRATNYKSSDGSVGVNGSFMTADSKVVTVKNGLIVSIQ